jgi:hypothetical protein
MLYSLKMNWLRNCAFKDRTTDTAYTALSLLVKSRYYYVKSVGKNVRNSARGKGIEI